MEFDVFDKLSDLETKIHLQKEEINNKDEYIKQILQQNELLRIQIEGYIKEITGYRKSQLSVPITTFDVEVQTDGEVKLVERSESGFAGNETSIADILKQTSDSVTQNTGYVFDQKTGLYFDNISGYYYDPENQLFFEPKRGVYYTYDNEKREYSYHSRVSAELSQKFKVLMEKTSGISKVMKLSENATNSLAVEKDGLSSPRQRRRQSRSSSRSSSHGDRRRYRRRSRSRRSRYRRRGYPRSYSSDSSSRSYISGGSPYRLNSRRTGERHRRRSNSSPSSSSDSYDRRSGRSHRGKKSRRGEASPPKQQPTCIAATPIVYPPSVRLMVLASSTTALPVGSVGVISSSEASSGWGCLGRNWNYCPLFDLTQDTDLDEIHSEIVFNKGCETYSVRDNKTGNGTFLNGTKLAKHEKKQLAHGDVLRLGSNKFLVHIHPGRDSCGQCEAAEVQAAIETVASTSQTPADTPSQLDVSSSSKEQHRRANINAPKLKYGLKKRNSQLSRIQALFYKVTDINVHFEPPRAFVTLGTPP